MLPSLIRYSTLLPQVSGVFQPRPRFSGLFRRIVSVGQVPSFPRRSAIPPHIVREAFRPVQPVVRVPRQTFTTDNNITSLSKSFGKLSVTETTSSGSSLEIIMASIGLAATAFLYNDFSQKKREELITKSHYEKEEDRQALIALLKNYASTISPQQLGDILHRLAQFSFRESSVLTDSHIEIVQLIMKELVTNDSKKLLQLQLQQAASTPFGLARSLARLTDARCGDLTCIIWDQVFKPTIDRACVDVFACKDAFFTSYNAYMDGSHRAQSIGSDMAEFIWEGVKGNYPLCRDSVSYLFPKIVDFYQKNEGFFGFSDMDYLCEAFCGISCRKRQPSKEFLKMGATLLSLCEKKWSSKHDFSSTNCFRCVRMMRKRLAPSEFEALVSSLELAITLGIAKSKVVKQSEQFCSKMLEYDACVQCPPSLLDRVICAFTKLGTNPQLIERLRQERAWMESDYQRNLYTEDVCRKLAHKAAETIVTHWGRDAIVRKSLQEIAEQKIMAFTTALENEIFQQIRDNSKWRGYPQESLPDYQSRGILKKVVEQTGIDVQLPSPLFLELFPLTSSRASTPKWLILLQTERADEVEIFCE